jgi:MRG-binding protein
MAFCSKNIDLILDRVNRRANLSKASQKAASHVTYIHEPIIWRALVSLSSTSRSIFGVRTICTMPPRKRARVSQASTPQPKASAEAISPEAQADKSNVLDDQWTDAEESHLFKSIIKFKPTGIEKHFRMLQIQKDFVSHGFISDHTRIPGIWAKLESLYDLDVLDQREKAHVGMLSDTDESEQEEKDEEEEEGVTENPWRRRDFELPDQEYEELAFKRRLDDSRSSSPEMIQGLSRVRNLLGDDELREKRKEYDKEDASSMRGKGRKATAARATRAKGARSTRSTPAEVEESEEVEEEEGSTVDESPQGKGKPKAASRTASTRKSRRR